MSTAAHGKAPQSIAKPQPLCCCARLTFSTHHSTTDTRETTKGESQHTQPISKQTALPGGTQDQGAAQGAEETAEDAGTGIFCRFRPLCCASVQAYS